MGRQTAVEFENTENELCRYGCGQVARYRTKLGKVGCSPTFHRCPAKIEERRKITNKQVAEGRVGSNKGCTYTRTPAIESHDPDLKCNWCGKPATHVQQNGDGICQDHRNKCPVYAENTTAWLDDEVKKDAAFAEHGEKIKKTVLKNYGVTNPCFTPGSKESYRKKRINSYNSKILNNPSTVRPLFTVEEYEGYHQYYPWRCSVPGCGHEFTKAFRGKIPMCPSCEMTRPEQAIYDMIKMFDPVINDRSILTRDDHPPLELDFWLPDHKLGIEVQGIYWHGTGITTRDAETHMIDKLKLAESKGVRLLQIYEDEIYEKPEIVRSRLLNFIGKSDSVIYARKCEVVNVGSVSKDGFLDTNHIQGSTRSTINLGLRYDGELVSVMTFTPPRVRAGYDRKEWDLNRFCNKLDTSVVGGASRLLKAFRKEHPDPIISFADRRWSSGELYDTLGFENTGVVKPSYWYFRDGETKRHHKFGFAKNKLAKKLDTFDPDLTELQNMEANGFGRVYDCGLLKFELVT